MKAGAAKTCITPPLGIPLGGEFLRPEAQYVHDHLWARCLFLEGRDSRIAFLTCDLAGLRQDFFDAVLGILRERLGLQEHELFINCTHTHSGPDVAGIMHGKLDHPYMEELPSLVAHAVLSAADCLGPARVGFGVSGVEGICMNRRVRMKGGGVRMNWEPIANDEIAGYGPIDPTLGVLRVDDASGKPIAALVHYTCHAAIVSPFPRQISADYPGLVCRTVERFWGDGAMAFFVNGAFGNINHIMCPGEYAARNKKAIALPFEEVERVGLPIAAKAIELLPTIATGDAPIGSASKLLNVDLRKPPYVDIDEALSARAGQQSRLDAAKERGDEDEAWSALIDLTYANHAVVLLESGEKDAPMRLSALRIGDLAIACVPAEIFVETGKAIRKQSPFSATWVSAITSGYTGYLPTEESFAEGGYEVRTCGWSKWARDADKVVIEESAGLLERLMSL